MEKRKISDELVQQLLDRGDAQRDLLAHYRAGSFNRAPEKVLRTMQITAAVPDVIRQRLGIPLCEEETCLALAVTDGRCPEHRP